MARHRNNGGKAHALVRIDLPEGKPDACLAAVGEVIREAMHGTLDVPEDDSFQIFSVHAPGSLSIDRTCLGIECNEDCVIIQATLDHGHSTQMKQAFYRAVADGLHARLELRTEDVFINLVEVARENGYFGNGEAQYAIKQGRTATIT